MKYLLLLLLLSSCTLVPSEWKRSEEVCKLNGGIKYVRPANFLVDGVYVQCNNGLGTRIDRFGE